MSGYILPVLGVILSCLGLMWVMIFSIRYHLTSRHLVVHCLGIPVRRFALKDIQSVSKRRRFRAEHWISTFKLKHRKLVIRRDRGLFREIVITPHYRYVFRRNLEQAVAAAQGNPLPGDSPETSNAE